jgi:hypothetical protein
MIWGEMWVWLRIRWERNRLLPWNSWKKMVFYFLSCDRICILTRWWCSKVLAAKRIPMTMISQPNYMFASKLMHTIGAHSKHSHLTLSNPLNIIVMQKPNYKLLCIGTQLRKCLQCLQFFHFFFIFFLP